MVAYACNIAWPRLAGAQAAATGTGAEAEARAPAEAGAVAAANKRPMQGPLTHWWALP